MRLHVEPGGALRVRLAAALRLVRPEPAARRGPRGDAERPRLLARGDPRAPRDEAGRAQAGARALGGGAGRRRPPRARGVGPQRRDAAPRVRAGQRPPRPRRAGRRETRAEARAARRRLLQPQQLRRAREDGVHGVGRARHVEEGRHGRARPPQGRALADELLAPVVHARGAGEEARGAAAAAAVAHDGRAVAVQGFVQAGPAQGRVREDVAERPRRLRRPLPLPRVRRRDHDAERAPHPQHGLRRPRARRDAPRPHEGEAVPRLGRQVQGQGRRQAQDRRLRLLGVRRQGPRREEVPRPGRRGLGLGV
mmetsp:Transcript_14735/g.48218  ORF Transcript_14735/g.48218 Transcript_14735/m.48218 type:complete len:309 (+) Transcript_14735:173-1099(+)